MGFIHTNLFDVMSRELRVVKENGSKVEPLITTTAVKELGRTRRKQAQKDEGSAISLI